jgi:VIT1/CCC1 family predicted Fe2+/Mn2+ transporter
MATAAYHDPALARMLILDELFDLSLYRALREVTDPDSRDVLDNLIRVEIEHLAFWQKFFDLKLTHLDVGRRVKLRLMLDICRLFGTTAVHLVLEAIEVHGVRKYLSLWKVHKDGPLGEALQGILMDEFKHEDMLVTQLTARQINAEKIRNIFLGLNDGLVEILGAVSGFFGAFGNAVTVLVATSTTAVAGALSMGAGAFLALNSEREMKATETDKKRFLGDDRSGEEMTETPLASAVVVGFAYLAGAIVPVLPVLLGADSPVFSVATAGLMVVLVSTILSFLSGMDIRRRILLNLVIISLAVGISYGIGLLAKSLWGISL